MNMEKLNQFLRSDADDDEQLYATEGVTRLWEWSDGEGAILIDRVFYYTRSLRKGANHAMQNL